METKHKNKPSEELVKKYQEILEKFLSAHNISVTIELWKDPLRIESYNDKGLIGITNHWIKKILISGNGFKDFEVSVFHGIDENMKDYKIWHDAVWIQDQIYKYLKLNPGNPLNKDPYWKLWDYLEGLEQ